jgi:Flp pilus assembly pilin Flp
MTLTRRLFADEAGLSRLAWAILVALAAVLAVRYWPQIVGIIDWLKNMGARLAGGAM